MMPFSRLSMFVSLFASAACGPRVDCEKLCARTTACAVTFMVDQSGGTPNADAGAADLDGCASGCENDPRVTVDAARCIDGIEVGDPAQCQQPVLTCLGADEMASE